MIGLTGCSMSSFKCLTGDCVPSSAWCNGHRDCPDNSDEPHGCNGSKRLTASYLYFAPFIGPTISKNVQSIRIIIIIVEVTSVTELSQSHCEEYKYKDRRNKQIFSRSRRIVTQLVRMAFHWSNRLFVHVHMNHKPAR